MSSSRFARLVQDAYTNNDIHAARQAFEEYQVSHCYHPRMQRIFDAHTQTYREIQIPCGECYHCMESKINEWCTRMYAHAEDFKNVYFVTLTYRSITDPENPCNKLLLTKLAHAVWNRDPFNSTLHLSYNPCLLVKAHYQKFIKRLRKNTGLKDITYVLSGEYGAKYGRPHFHMILFTNGTLKRDDIARAWSVALWRKDNGEWSYKTSQQTAGTAYYFPIGRIDFHDLVSNGTFNTTARIRIDGTYMNAANCFAYVCKYVCKRDDANLSRVNLAFNRLFTKEKYVFIGEDDIPYNTLQEYCKVFRLKYNNELITNLNYRKHEKTIFSPQATVFLYGLSTARVLCKDSVEYVEEFYPSNYLDFRNRYRPFCEFSRGTPIGSVYADRNISEFTQGVYTKPLLQDKGFVVPSYFRDKAQQHLYGLREIRRTISGTSFALSGLVDLQRHFDSGSAVLSSLPRNKTASDIESLPCSVLRTCFRYTDLSTGEKIAFDGVKALHYKFDRHLRKYVNTRNVPVSEFIRHWCSALQKEYERYGVQLSRSKDNLRLQERGILMLTDLGDEYSTLVNRFIRRNTQVRESTQKQYNEIHNSVE